MSQQPSEEPPRPLGATGRTILGAYILLLSGLLVYLLYEFWPTAGADGRIPDSRTITLFGDLIDLTVSAEVQLILLVVIVAALGSYVHAATSFATFVGNRRIYSSWVWWYILRVSIGVSLALVFYFVVRGGFLSTGAGADDVSPFGIAAVAGLTGMFSKQATDKLEEVFNTIFARESPDQRADKLDNPVPEIAGIEPDAVSSGAGEMDLVIRGANFIPESAAKVNGVSRSTEFEDSSRLTVRILASDLASPGAARIAVVNPPPGGGTSNEWLLTIQ